MINDVDFKELESEKYWSFPKSYKKDARLETKNMIFSGDYIGSRKMDGAYYRFIKEEDGTMILQGRSRSVNGNFLNKIGHVPQLQSFFDKRPNGTCLLGELYFPENEGSSNVTTIMGCLEKRARERQEKGNKLHYYIFDIWAWDGRSYLSKPAVDRFNDLEELSHIYTDEYIEWAEYFSGKELWEKLQEILANGGEGIVMTRKETSPEPGKRSARKTLKIKKELEETIDCIFTGRFTSPTKLYSGKEIEKWQYWESIIDGEKLEGDYYLDYIKGKPIEPVTKPYFYGWAGSLEIGLVKGDKVIPIGYLSGLTDDIKSRPLDFKGKVIEISCMEITQNQNGGFGLRHAKLVKFRPDLNITDCNWEKVFS